MAFREVVGHLQEKVDSHVEVESPSTVSIRGTWSYQQQGQPYNLVPRWRLSATRWHGKSNYLNIQLTLSSDASDRMVHRASDFFSFQFTF